MFKVGLTGGIGCGKTTVTGLFEAKGVPVIDADQVARRLVEPGEPAFAEIIDHFGEQLLDPDGRLDRAQLRGLIFSSTESREKLESILHPRVYQAMSETSRQLDSIYCILSIPLLLETGRQNCVDRILVVDCPIEMQYHRTVKRDRISRDAVKRIIESQVSRETRRLAADDLISNDVAIECLVRQIDQLHNFYLTLAR